MHYTKEGYVLLGRHFARQGKALVTGQKPAANGKPKGVEQWDSWLTVCLKKMDSL